MARSAAGAVEQLLACDNISQILDFFRAQPGRWTTGNLLLTATLQARFRTPQARAAAAAAADIQKIVIANFEKGLDENGKLSLQTTMLLDSYVNVF